MIFIFTMTLHVIHPQYKYIHRTLSYQMFMKLNGFTVIYTFYLFMCQNQPILCFDFIYLEMYLFKSVIGSFPFT